VQSKPMERQHNATEDRATPPASSQLRRHSNSFDVLRLLAAAFVVWSHQHALLGLPEPAVAILDTSFGGLGVFIFFAISGYLNTLSVFHHRSARVFLLNRALRIYPALAVCVLFTVVLGFCVATDLHAYLGMKLISYVVKDVTLFTGVKAGVPGVFETNAFPEALNGSLWTLPYEVKMYVALVVVLAACRYSLVAPILLFAAAAITSALIGLGVVPPFQGDQFWLQFSTLFLTGSAIAAIEILGGIRFAIAAVALTAAVTAAMGNHFFASELLLTAFIVAVGRVRLPHWLRPPIDLSYSVYLYAFPVQQTVALYTKDFWPALAISASGILALATLSVLFVELPALRLKRRESIGVIAVPQPSPGPVL
jgi:peptidoglycan/LPS O-acetylase OafA/YrhL